MLNRGRTTRTYAPRAPAVLEKRDIRALTRRCDRLLDARGAGQCPRPCRRVVQLVDIEPAPTVWARPLLASRALASRERGEDQLVRVVDHRAGFVCFNRAIEIDRVPVALVGVVDHAAKPTNQVHRRRTGAFTQFAHRPRGRHLSDRWGEHRRQAVQAQARVCLPVPAGVTGGERAVSHGRSHRQEEPPCPAQLGYPRRRSPVPTGGR
jgi:hypothetical protein